MSMRDFVKAVTCLLLGHKWISYFYPRNDGWFRPHGRRECERCGVDQPASGGSK
jgi:hypothetical protein